MFRFTTVTWMCVLLLNSKRSSTSCHYIRHGHQVSFPTTAANPVSHETGATFLSSDIIDIDKTREGGSYFFSCPSNTYTTAAWMQSWVTANSVVINMVSVSWSRWWWIVCSLSTSISVVPFPKGSYNRIFWVRGSFESHHFLNEIPFGLFEQVRHHVSSYFGSKNCHPPNSNCFAKSSTLPRWTNQALLCFRPPVASVSLSTTQCRWLNPWVSFFLKFCELDGGGSWEHLSTDFDDVPTIAASWRHRHLGCWNDFTVLYARRRSESLLVPLSINKSSRNRQQQPTAANVTKCCKFLQTSMLGVAGKCNGEIAQMW